MTERDQGQEMIRAANRFADAAERLSASLDRFVETRESAGAQFEIFRDDRGEYHWRLHAADGEILATSGEGYRTKADAERGAERLKDAVSRPRGRVEGLAGDLILGLVGAGGMPDDEAADLADDVVHRARAEMGRNIEAEALNEEEIARWWRKGGADPGHPVSDRPPS